MTNDEKWTIKASLFLLLLFVLIVSCTKKIETISKPIERVKLQLPVPEPIKLENIEWYIIKQKEKNYIGISVSDYKKLALNMEKINNFILKQNDLIKVQKDYYERDRSRHKNSSSTERSSSD